MKKDITLTREQRAMIHSTIEKADIDELRHILHSLRGIAFKHFIIYPTEFASIIQQCHTLWILDALEKAEKKEATHEGEKI